MTWILYITNKFHNVIFALTGNSSEKVVKVQPLRFEASFLTREEEYGLWRKNQKHWNVCKITIINGYLKLNVA